MPLYEFFCEKCAKSFEEIVSSSVSTAICPQCGAEDCRRMVSMPSPMLKGAFPYKPGPVMPVGKFRNGAPGCGQCGGSCKNDGQ